jgi:hypothetical protein
MSTGVEKKYDMVKREMQRLFLYVLFVCIREVRRYIKSCSPL